MWLRHPRERQGHTGRSRLPIYTWSIPFDNSVWKRRPIYVATSEINLDRNWQEVHRVRGLALEYHARPYVLTGLLLPMQDHFLNQEQLCSRCSEIDFQTFLRPAIEKPQHNGEDTVALAPTNPRKVLDIANRASCTFCKLALDVINLDISKVPVLSLLKRRRCYVPNTLQCSKSRMGLKKRSHRCG